MAAVWAAVGMIAGSLGQLVRNLTVRKPSPAPSLKPRPAPRWVSGADLSRWTSQFGWIAAVAALIVITVSTFLVTRRFTRPQGGTQRPASSTNSLPTVKESWSYRTGLPWRQPWAGSADSFHTPAIGNDGTIYALSDHGVLALNTGGDLKWNYTSRFDPQISIVIADDGAIWSGSPVGWLTRTTEAGEGQPQFGGPGSTNQLALSPNGDLLVCGNNMSNSIATSGYPKEGRAITDGIRPGVGPVQSAAFASNAAITVRENTVTSWPLDFTQANWQKKVGWRCQHPAIARDGTIYLSCIDKMLAIGADGSDKWSIPIQMPTPAVIAEDGTVFFGGITDGNVYSVAPDGQVRWKFATGKAMISTPAISRSGVLYVGSQTNYLYALDASGKPKWVFQAQGEVLSPTIGPDGTVYVQTTDGVLHAIAQPENGGLAGQWPKLDADQRNTARAPE
jgi:outer membrane protein assembly factor BamB